MYNVKDIEDECREAYLMAGRWQPTTDDLLKFFSKKITDLMNVTQKLSDELAELKKP